jgi:hypothetical protein
MPRPHVRGLQRSAGRQRERHARVVAGQLHGVHRNVRRGQCLRHGPEVERVARLVRHAHQGHGRVLGHRKGLQERGVARVGTVGQHRVRHEVHERDEPAEQHDEPDTRQRVVAVCEEVLVSPDLVERPAQHHHRVADRHRVGRGDALVGIGRVDRQGPASSSVHGGDGRRHVAHALLEELVSAAIGKWAHRSDSASHGEQANEPWSSSVLTSVRAARRSRRR